MDVGAARMEDQADLDKEYTAEMNVRLIMLVGTVKVKGPSVKGHVRWRGGRPAIAACGAGDRGKTAGLFREASVHPGQLRAARV